MNRLYKKSTAQGQISFELSVSFRPGRGELTLLQWQTLKKLLKAVGPVWERFLRFQPKRASSTRPRSTPRAIPRIEMGIFLCGRHRIKTLNAQYRNKDRPTDVLSFPLHLPQFFFPSEGRKSDGMDKWAKGQCVLSLGDIVICQEVACKQAKQYSVTYNEELLRLLTHGFLHLCGYDHELSPADAKIMFEWEERLINLASGRHATAYTTS